MKCITYNQAEKIFDAAKTYNQDTYASIDNLKGVGNTTVPIYFDADGKPQAISVDLFAYLSNFETDENGDLMPKETDTVTLSSNISATNVTATESLNLSGGKIWIE